MKLIPNNRHLLIEEIVGEEKEESYVLVPDDYSKVEEPYGLYLVLDSAEDCNLDFQEDDTIVVLNSMVEEINVANERFLIVLENHVVGFLEEE